MRYDDWRATRFFPGLEGLRAIAALLVVFHHARTHRLWGVLEGWNGVTLFFVLSGFLITTLALREEDERGALRWRAFFVRRGFRILPVYVASLALYAAAMFALGISATHRTSFVQAVPWFLSPFPEVPFFTHVHVVFSLAWSLGIEEKFYLLWPLLAFVVLRKRGGARLALAVVLALVCQLPLALTGGGRALAPYSAILVGCVLASLLHDRRTFPVVARLGTRRPKASASPPLRTTFRTRSRRRSSSARSRCARGPSSRRVPCASWAASATRCTCCTRSPSAWPHRSSHRAARPPSSATWRSGSCSRSRSRMRSIASWSGR
jgi:hypothetical protein